MKKIKTIALFGTIIISAVAFKLGDINIKIKGSDTVLPLSQKEAEVFMKKNPMAKITVIGGGSGVGIAAFLDGTTDIAMSSRKIKMSEKMKLQDAGKAYKEVVIANDALSIIVNPNNKVSQLTREQLEGIFTGKITNWKDVGGDDEKIIAYSRESSSGTYEFFKEHVLNNKNYGSTVLNMPATGAIVQSISQTKGAIGYIGLAYMEKTVKDVKVSYDKGKTYVEATVPNAQSKTYPITRPLYYYYLTKDAAKVKPLIDFILSADGQKIVGEVGYVPLSK
ncbi:MAG: PstS family phosphate ABC transporter substrate-binding protein [Bacteroidetes bacterium]|nr:MAG: PstS family phosphate ABC transporter substrate-binding protein [Bacteroidota bacterium]